MKFRLFASAIISLTISLSVAAQGIVLHGKVIDVEDGATVVVMTKSNSQLKVKCQAVISPTLQEAFGPQSKERLFNLSIGQLVTVEVSRRNQSGDIVGSILLNGDDVCLDQVRAGMARFDREHENELSASKRQGFLALESIARNTSVGIWEDSTQSGTARIGRSNRLGEEPTNPRQTAVPPVDSPTQSSTASATSTDNTASSTVDVSGYFRKDGTYVEPHKRTSPDSTFDNNWSTVGNVNPVTGNPGTKNWLSRHWWIFPAVGGLVVTGFVLRNRSLEAESGSGSIVCNDGTISNAQHRQGACSWHGGIRP